MTYSIVFALVFVNRNRRFAQGDRLSSITTALQYGSESEEDAILTGNSTVEDRDVTSIYYVIICFNVSLLSYLVYTNQTTVSMFLRLCSLRRRWVRGREHPLQHGHVQPHLPDVRGSAGRQKQPGTAPSRALLSAALQERLPRLLPANQPSNLPPADKVQ